MANKLPSSAGINVEEMLKSMGLDPVEVTEKEESLACDGDEERSAKAPQGVQDSLDALFERARLDAAKGMPSAKNANGAPALPACNGLFNDKLDELAALIEVLARFVPLSGSASGYGFLNIASAFVRESKSGELDDLDNREYNKLVRHVNKLGKIWEGSAVVQGFPLVRNAMFYIMLHDPDLFDEVYLRTLEWLETCAWDFEEVGVSLK